MVSIKDVARKANVSATTVSAVVNGLNCVKPSTRDKVLAVIEELKYTPNLSARELVTNKKQNVGLIFTVYDKNQIKNHTPDSLCDIAYYEYVTNIVDFFGNSGYGLLSENFIYNEESKSLPKMIEQKRVDGAFVIGALYPKELIGLLKERVNAIVTVGCSSDVSDFSQNDYVESISMAVDYLIQKGHHRIAYVSGCILSDAYEHKLFGYKTSMEKHGIPYDDLVYQSQFLVSSGYEIAKEIFSLPKEKRPTAVLFGSDVIAVGAYRYCNEHRINIPDDISFLGYENLIVSGLLYPALSTVELHKDLIAKEACWLMVQRLKKPGGKLIGSVIPCTIVERDSVKDIN